DVQKVDPKTGQLVNSGTIAHDGIKFMRYHHTEMNASNLPVLVGEPMTFTTNPAPGGGKNLFRGTDTRPINKIPLAEVSFIEESPEVTIDQIGASPHAVVSVMVVPAGTDYSKGMRMTQD